MIAGLSIALAPIGAHAQSSQPPLSFTDQTIASWLAMVTATQAEQPHWEAPLATTTPRLVQEFAYNQNITQAGNGNRTINYGGGKGLELIPTPNIELLFGIPPYEQVTTPAGKTITGFGDWPAFLMKYRFISANEQQGNYIVTGFIQVFAPTGADELSNHVYIVQPTLAFGKGWGDFDFQVNLSEQYPVDSIAAGALQKYGDPLLGNVVFQYHLLEYFWPEFDVNYTYWPNGEHQGLNQVLLTPGIVIGRIPLGLGPRVKLNFGLGYQVAVTSNPVTRNNFIFSVRLDF